MALPGPTRIITVEPIRRVVPTPQPIPAKEPERIPAERPKTPERVPA